MTYVTEDIASTLKAARESKGLSQRALSRVVGVPQSHISKIENGAVDLRLSSLVTFARVLDLEVVLVPRKAVSAVKSIVRSCGRTNLGRGEGSQQAVQALKRLQNTLAGVKGAGTAARELAQLRRQVRDLQHFRLARSDLDAIQAADQSLQAFLSDAGNLSAVRQSLSQLQGLRSALAHSVGDLPPIKSARPAYSLDEDNSG